MLISYFKKALLELYKLQSKYFKPALSALVRTGNFEELWQSILKPVALS